jgi:hypothetical protein
VSTLAQPKGIVEFLYIHADGTNITV